MTLWIPYIFKHSGLQMPNRIALAPMTNTQSHDDGSLGDDEYKWLIRRAKGGFGMIITCAAHVSADGQGWPGELGIYHDKHLDGLRQLSEGIHAHHSLAVVQIFHGGARSPESIIGCQPWSASAHEMSVGKSNIQVRAATAEDIVRVMDDFVNAAIRARDAGFDGVELHGAHGYLLHQFISTATNVRQDVWGGSFENRIRLIRTILQKIREKLPDGFIVGVRISPEDKFTFRGIDFDESLGLARLLATDGADYIHISPWEALKRPDKYTDIDKLLITYFREKIPSEIALMVAGQIWSADDAHAALSAGADIVALGRAAIGMPDWPQLARSPAFKPVIPPYTTDHLKNASLGDSFIQYMKKWKGFVVEDD